jgi:hypothetical protein
MLLSKVADCVRLGFHPRAIGDRRGLVAFRASLLVAAGGILLRPPMSARGHWVLRTSINFLVRIKGIRANNTVMDKSIPGSKYPATLFHVEQRLTG